MKKQLKKVTTFTLASVMALSMGSVTTVFAEDGEYKGHTLNVGIWGGNDQEAAALDKMKTEFEKKTGAEIVFKTYTDYNTQIQADFIAKTAPDVFYIDASMFPFYADLGVMEPLDAEEMEADKYYENLISAFTAEDGTLYCIPKDVSTLATYYNIGILESVGMTADDIPGSLEEYKEFLPELQAKLDEEYGEGMVAAMTYNPELSRQIYVMEENGASIIDENGMSTMSTDGVVENVQFLVDLVQTGAVKTPQDLGLGWNGEAFGVGKAAIMEEGNWVYGTLKKDYSDINFGVKEMPTYNGNQHSMSFTVGYGISAVSEEKELAKEWIKYATGEEGMKIWSSGAGCLPSRPAVADAMDVESDPVWAVHAKMIDIATPWQRGTTVSIIDSTYKNFIPAAFKGEAGVKETLEQIDAQANSEIENAM
ncbi:sugar ABC transporter substrate-binding protein [Blautia sp. XA-2221]|uniref:sugar ABC transporter substrate-binding protein n=1 Tax=Blautia sp. XA-2221 TaxID=2903961 RepID=UPI0023781597|nr:extracellular solute-binding protein [Blautia sp. XA-2221]